jgi:alanine racemase
MFETLFGKEDRPLELRTNFKYDICIDDFSKKDKNANGSAADFYRVRTRVSYTKVLRDKVFLIGCAMNNRQLAALFEEERCEYRWLLTGRDESFRGTDFKVGSVRIDGLNVPVIKTDCTNRGYEIWCGGESLAKKVRQPVKMEMEIETRKARTNNLFSAYLVYPTRGMEICFNYEGSSLRNVRHIGFFAGKHSSPEVTEKKGKWIKLRINDDEWIFPTSGVTFIWDI